MIYLHASHARTESRIIGDLPGRYIYLSRELYSLYFFQIPKVEAKELEHLLLYRIRSMHPEPSDKTTFDYRIMKQKNCGCFAMTAVSSRDFIEQLNREYPHKTVYIPLFHLIDRRETKGGVTLFYNNPEGKKNRDIFLPIPSPALFSRNGVIDAKTDTAAKCRPVSEYREDFFASPPADAGIMRIMKKPGYRGAFWGKRRSVFSSFPFRLAGYLLFFGALFLGTDVYFLEQRKSVAAELGQEYARKTALAAELQALRSEREQLYHAFTRLTRQKTIQPWSFFTDLEDILYSRDTPDGNYELREIRTEGESFFLHLRGCEPLGIADDFEGNPRFRSVRIYNLLPVDDGSGREDFFVSGEYEP